MAALAAAKLMLARLTLILLELAFVPRSVAALDVVAKAAVLMDARTGTILWKKKEHLQQPPASTAKILTALVILERNRLDDIVGIPAVATKVTGATIPLEVGEQLPVEALLFAMLLGSGNDAAAALAHYSAGSIGGFAALMNQKAQSLGARRSKFLNPTGLPQAGQLSTAQDLAFIAKAALSNGEFRRIIAARAYPWKSARRQGELKNSNRLLDDYAGAIGVKTGNTQEAGYCLVAAASRSDKTFIAVVLNSREKTVWQDAKSLLDYGFASSR